MFLFSSLSLTGTHIPDAITLSATKGFPARQYDFLFDMYRNRKGWNARSPYKNCPRLSLELGERIGGGRTGVVYAARLVETPFKEEKEGAIVDSELCVKIARPNRSRTLAREAWVYDQLTEGSFQGASVPRCYGFFTANSSPAEMPVGLW